MASGEDGRPLLNHAADSVAAKALIRLAENIREQIENNSRMTSEWEPKKIELTDDGAIKIEWPDGHKGTHTAHALRISCPCAQCVDEDTGKRTLDTSRVPLDIRIKAYGGVGRYGMSFDFSDGHNTGIYSMETLRELCECSECIGSKNSSGEFSV
jgi:DUF971 family protein